MSITAFLFLAIYSTGLILTFYRPYYGILTYIFEWHHHPPYFWWGANLPDIRWSYTIALALLISTLIHRKQLPPVYVSNIRPIFWIIFLLINMYLVSSTTAVLPEASLAKTLEIFKILIFFILLIFLVRTPEEFQGMIWVLILCVSHFGLIALGGSNRDIGVIAPNATEENALSAHVMAALPFFGVYFLESRWWHKALIAAGGALSLNLIILANSRATFLGLLAIAAAAIFLFRGKIRFMVIGGLTAASIVFLVLTNDDFWKRQAGDTYNDGSATSRLHIWKGGWEMLKDYPMGVGGEGFVHLSLDYIPVLDVPKSQHNTFIAILTDWGYLGLFFYLGFLTHIFRLISKVKSLARQVPALQHYGASATALQLALIGLSAAGMFHSRQYAEVIYWLSAFAIMLYNIQRNELIHIYNQYEKQDAYGRRVTIAALPAASKSP